MTEAMGEGLRTGRLEGPQKVNGDARFTSDLHLPGQLVGAVLRCPHASARVRRVDTEAARGMPGVHAVLTAAEAPAMAWYEEKVPLFPERVRFAGEEIAAVAAESEEVLQDALRALRVEYEILPAVSGLDAALAPGAPTVHEDAPGNLAGDVERYARGDVDAALAAAEIVVEATYITPTALHNALEPHGCVAWWEEGVLRLWVSTQGIFAVREGVAGKLGLSLNAVRVEARHVGGGFGAKQIEWKDSVIAALLARAAGRPVSLMLDREAENLAVGNRNGTRQHVRLGAARDGRLCAIDLRAEVDIGAYRAGGESSFVVGCYQSLYACPNVRTEQRNYYSNLGPAVAFRAPGFVEGAFGLEQAMDELARRLGLDPFELRLRNYSEVDQTKGKSWSSPQALRRCYELLRDSFGWPQRAETVPPGRRRGIGMAAAIWVAGAPSPPGEARVILHADGSATVLSAIQDIGTGTRTALARIAADALGLPLERVRLELGDTGTGLRSPTSSGSSTLPTMGPAVHEAARRAKSAEGEERSGYGSCTSSSETVSVRTFAAVCAEVEVDTGTGEVRVLRLACAPDCGRIVDRLTADSQVIGGLVQGLGFALTEERVVDPASALSLNANLEDYLIPTVMDTPELVHVPVDLPDTGANALGVKGLGEPPIIAVAPAIANAVFDALGLRLRELPLSRRRVLEALKAVGEGQ